MAWSPPAIGAPCWLKVCAKDVQRARQFYATVFNWSFRTTSHHVGQNPDYAPDRIAHFDTPGSPKQSGGITKVDESEFIHTKGRGGVTLYLYVDDLEITMEKIVGAGGTKLSEPEAESDFGMMQTFEDTEGNFVALYAWKTSSPASSEK